MYKIFLLIAVLLSPNLAMACGTVGWAIDGIYKKGPMKKFSREKLFAGLAKVGGPCQKLSNYNPSVNQKKVAKLLLDDQHISYLKRFGKKIFLEFDCLITQKNKATYPLLTSRYGIGGCPSEDILFVTSTNGGNLRSTPNISNNKLTVLPEGAKLKVLARKGEWVEIEVLHYNRSFTPPCKFKKPCKKGFVHESLIQ